MIRATTQDAPTIHLFLDSYANVLRPQQVGMPDYDLVTPIRIGRTIVGSPENCSRR
jgi:hypothetical protein